MLDGSINPAHAAAKNPLHGKGSRKLLRLLKNPPIAASLQKIQTLVYFYIPVDLEFFLLLALEGF